MIEEQDERLQPLINAAEQFVAAYADGNVSTLLEYFEDIFKDSLTGNTEGDNK